MRTILIGIDDTDNLDSPGTGHIARKLCGVLVGMGFQSRGVTRHQFLVDDAIPYTSHNSGACIGVSRAGGIEAVDFVFDYIADISAEGSDPGVCIAYCDDVNAEITEFGKTAQKIVVKIADSFKIAKSGGVKLYGLGGNCQGVIGALGSVGLRAGGNDGRFIDMPGLRDLPQRVSKADLSDIGVEIEYAGCLHEPLDDAVCDTLGWARPGLKNGKAVLKVEWSEKENVWIPVDRKKK
ncbi:MAG: hypothetical protein FVQ82_03990 [Planctomycetes bacterium]|nr:hypothetical protein [Planctomycetota bacterium]